MTIKEVTAILENIAPLSYQEPYDNSGLIVGSIKDEVSRALLCLDSIEEVIEEAIDKNCQLVIAHHPIVFSALKKLNGKNYIERVIMKAIKNDIAIYACHTNLDNVLKRGVNQKIAEKLRLENTKILSPKTQKMSKLVVYSPKENADAVRENLFLNGAGNISDYSNCSFNSEGTGTYLPGENTNPTLGEKGKTNSVTETKIEVVVLNHLIRNVLAEVNKVHPYEEVAYEIIPLANPTPHVGSGMIGELNSEMDTMEFLRFIKKEMKTNCVRYTSPIKKTVKKIALCGGAGSFLLEDAKRKGADVFITGDYKYHQFFDAENEIVIADIGHFESEQFTIDLFEEILSNSNTGLDIIKTKVNTNPVNYL